MSTRRGSVSVTLEISPSPRRSSTSSRNQSAKDRRAPEPELESEYEDELLGDDEEEVTRCVCMQIESFGVMVQCETCAVWQHCDCMNLNPKKLPKHYYCEECKPENHTWITTGKLSKAQRERLLSLTPRTNSPNRRRTMNSREAAQPYSELLFFKNDSAANGNGRRSSKESEESDEDEVSDFGSQHEKSGQKRKRNDTKNARQQNGKGKGQDNRSGKRNAKESSGPSESSSPVDVQPGKRPKLADSKDRSSNGNRDPKSDVGADPKLQESKRKRDVNSESGGSQRRMSGSNSVKKELESGGSDSDLVNVVSGRSDATNGRATRRASVPDINNAVNRNTTNTKRNSTNSSSNNNASNKSANGKAEVKPDASSKRVLELPTSDSPPSNSRKKPKVEPPRKPSGTTTGSRSRPAQSKRVASGTNVTNDARAKHSQSSSPSNKQLEIDQGFPNQLSTPPVKVRTWNNRASLGEMNKRVKQMSDYLTKLQVQMATEPKVELPPPPSSVSNHSAHVDSAVPGAAEAIKSETLTSRASESTPSTHIIPLLSSPVMDCKPSSSASTTSTVSVHIHMAERFDACSTSSLSSLSTEGSSPMKGGVNGVGRAESAEESSMDLLDRLERSLMKFQERFGSFVGRRG